MHCFEGRSKWAVDAAQKYGWVFSIPCNARRHRGFQKLMEKLPEDCLLTETDAPYLAPERSTRNEPANVVMTVQFLAEIRKWSRNKAAETIWSNFERLFRI